MKHKKTVDKIFDVFVALDNKCDDLFKTSVFLMCEVTPILESADSETKNKMIDELNELINSNFSNKGMNNVDLEFNTIIGNAPEFLESKKYNQL